MSAEKEEVYEATTNSDKKSIDNDQYLQNDSWTPDEKASVKDAESQKYVVFDENADEYDIAIVNEITTLEDDPTLKSFTLRAVIIGVILSAVSASVYQLMIFKPVGIPLTNTFMLIVAYLFCTAWARWLPVGGWLNPGPFNVKEHTCVYVMISSANTSAYASWILSAQELYYTQTPGAAGSIFLLFATQLVGYGIAGQLRPFLVYPASIIWPQSLPTVSLLKTFNTPDSDARWHTKFFFAVFGIIFVYEFIPQYMFPMIGGISIFCLAKNDNVWFKRLFGGLNVNEGMGILQLSFDWNLLSYYTPMVIPLWVQLNIYAGILILWIMGPLVYYYNVWDAQSFPFLSNSIFQNFGNGTSAVYPQKEVLNADNTLNQTMLAEIGHPQFSTIGAINYIFINFGVTATVTHVALFYGKDLWRQIKLARTKFGADENDVHMRLMKAYKEVPSWWYYTLFVLGIALNIGIAYANHSQLPWWGVIVAILISSALSLPLNLITAVTGSGFGLNVLTEMICGYMLPGLPVANMYFKTLGYNTMAQAGVLAKDLKIGHYLKVAPRAIFWNQIVGTVIGCIFNYILNVTIVNNERDILLDPNGSQFWNGATPQTINSAAVTYGAVGPSVMFGPDTKYYIILWAFVIGFFLPIPGWLLHRKWPKVGFNYVNIPMVLAGACTLPGTNSSWITVSFIIVLVFQGYVKRRHREWFTKNNYLISAALDSGTSFMVFFVSIALQGGASGEAYSFPIWWGNREDLPYMDQCCANC